MPMQSQDADKAAEFAKKAEKHVNELKVERAAAEASLAVYYQLRAMGSEQSAAMNNLAGQLRRHGGFMEEFGPGGQA